MKNTELFLCSCGLYEHQLILSPEGVENDYMSGAFHLDSLGFIGRLRAAVKYIAGKERTNGDFDDFLFDNNDTARFVSLVDRVHNKAIENSVASETGVRHLQDNASGESSCCRWTFESNDNEYVVDVIKSPITSGDSCTSVLDVSITPFMKKGNLLYRLRRGLKHIFGYKSNFGEFDRFDFSERDFARIREIVSTVK